MVIPVFIVRHSRGEFYSTKDKSRRESRNFKDFWIPAGVSPREGGGRCMTTKNGNNRLFQQPVKR